MAKVSSRCASYDGGSAGTTKTSSPPCRGASCAAAGSGRAATNSAPNTIPLPQRERGQGEGAGTLRTRRPLPLPSPQREGGWRGSDGDGDREGVALPIHA